MSRQSFHASPRAWCEDLKRILSQPLRGRLRTSPALHSLQEPQSGSSQPESISSPSMLPPLANTSMSGTTKARPAKRASSPDLQDSASVQIAVLYASKVTLGRLPASLRISSANLRLDASLAKTFLKSNDFTYWYLASLCGASPYGRILTRWEPTLR